MIFFGYLLTFGWVFFILVLTTVLKKAVSLSDEGSRKLVHISVAFAWIPMYCCFGATWHLLVPSGFFTVFNYLSFRFNLLSAMERQDAAKRSPGTVYYALSMLIMSLLCLWDPDFLIPYGIGVFCMALGDGLAPLAGTVQKGNRFYFGGRRSLFGTLTVFLICFAVTTFLSVIFRLPYTLPDMLLLAVCGAILEFVGAKGFDNLTLPLGICLLAWLLR